MEFEILRLTPESTEVGNTLTATVKLATHTPDYVIFRSPEGYRIDWEASREKWLAAEDARFREAHGLVDASIEVKLVKQKYYAGSTTLVFEFTNRSDAHLAGATIEATAFGENGRYLTKGFCFVKDLPPGESTFESMLFLQVAPSDLKTWNLKMRVVRIQTSSGGTQLVDKYFKLKDIDGSVSDSAKKDQAVAGDAPEVRGSPDAAIKAFRQRVAEHSSKAAKEGQTPEIKAEALALKRERNELLRKFFQKGQGGFVAPQSDLTSEHKHALTTTSSSSPSRSDRKDNNTQNDLHREARSLEAELLGKTLRDLNDDGTINSDYGDIKSRVDILEGKARGRLRGINRQPTERGYSLQVRKEAALRTLVQQGYSPSEARKTVEAMVKYNMLPDPPR